MKNSPRCDLATLAARPAALVSVADPKDANILSSHQAAKRWAETGKLPEPLRLPNGAIRRLAGDVLKAIGIEEVPHA
jgi:hypothetical protein